MWISINENQFLIISTTASSSVSETSALVRVLSMKVLFPTTGETLLASCFMGWAFYVLSWFFYRPFILHYVETQFSRFVTLPRKEMDDLIAGLHIRAVGSVHNTIQVLLSLWALTDPVLWADTWHAVTPLSHIILIISSGFFLWDTVVAMRRIRVDGADFIVHGLLCGMFFFYVACSKNFHFYGCSFLLWEMSTPFVQTRWLLAKLGLKRTKLFFYNGITMIIAFGLCRILWGGYLGARFFISSAGDQDEISSMSLWILRFICIILNGLNWNWFRKMVIGAFRLFGKAQSSPAPPATKIESNGKKET